MGVTIFRPGQRLVIPGVQVMQTSASAVAARWLAGSISAANCIAAYEAKGAADLASSYINLANPGTYNLTVGVAPTWDATNGWAFNGTTQYLHTNIVPAANWTMLVKFSGRTNTGYLAGATPGGSFFWIQPFNGTNHRYAYGGGVATVSGAVDSGVLALAGVNAYRDGVSDGTVGSTWTGTPLQIMIGCRNNAGVADSLYAGNIQRIYIYDIVLSGAQIATQQTSGIGS